MKRSIVCLAASACLVALLGAATPASAAGFISFVSDSGSDAANCETLATACRQITFALTQTNEGGIIHVLPGEYVAFAPDKSIEIVADAGQASIFTTTVSDAGIAVNVSGTSAVRIGGFRISAAHGILINGSGGTVHIEDCTILPAQTKTGIVYAPTGASELYVSDTTISGSGAPNAGGISIRPTGSGSAKVVLDNVKVQDNTRSILIDGNATTGSNTVTVRNSVVAGNPLLWTDARSAVSTYLGTYEKREVSLPSRVRPAASLMTPTSTLLTTQRVGR